MARKQADFVREYECANAVIIELSPDRRFRYYEMFVKNVSTHLVQDVSVKIVLKTSFYNTRYAPEEGPGLSFAWQGYGLLIVTVARLIPNSAVRVYIFDVREPRDRDRCEFELHWVDHTGQLREANGYFWVGQSQSEAPVKPFEIMMNRRGRFDDDELADPSR